MSSLGRMMRKSSGIRSWEARQELVQEWEGREKAEHVSASLARERFLADCEARGLRKETMWKYKLMARDLIEMFERRPVDAVSVGDLAALRESWRVGADFFSEKDGAHQIFFQIRDGAGMG